MLTSKELQAIRTLSEAATQGNLRLMDDGIVIEDDGSVIADFSSNHDDAILLIHARTDIRADAPRYRALGNSMAVPVMRWIGERIAAVDVR